MTDNKISFKPLADRVLVKPLPAEQKTSHGLYLPDSAQQAPQHGTIIAVGPGTEKSSITVQVGDQVIYGKYNGQEIKLDGDKFLVLRESDLLGVVAS